MIILHAGLFEEEFFIWGETPPKGKKKRGGKYSPYSVEFDELKTAAGLKRVDPADVFVHLPSRGTFPLPSTSLIDVPPASRSKITVTPWLHYAVNVPLKKRVNFLLDIYGKNLLDRGVIIGRDLAFWSSALFFAADLAFEGKYLPDVAKTREGYKARWRPVFEGSDKPRLFDMASAMPDACRSVSSYEEKLINSKREVLIDFITQTLNYFVKYRDGKKPKISIPKKFDSLHDQWMTRLNTISDVMEGDEKELRNFYEEVRNWQRPLTSGERAPFKFCFRLEEPVSIDEESLSQNSEALKWELSCFLQASEDPSLILPLEKLWKPDGKIESIISKKEFNLREFLIQSLGRAASLSPLLGRMLLEREPSGMILDTAGAFDFLIRWSWNLEQAGFGVFLPSWWTAKGTKSRLSARAKVKSSGQKMGSGGVISLDNLIEFNWEVSIGDQKISLEELEALAEIKEPLVKIRGKWVQVKADEIREALRHWKRKLHSKASLREILSLYLGHSRGLGTLPFEGITAEGPVSDFLSHLEGKTAFEEIPAPDNFNGTLRPYQLKGYSWLNFLKRWGLGACLADDMGLGKTIQVLALVQKDYVKDKRPILVVCPTSVTGNWKKEAKRFTPDVPAAIHHGPKRKKGPAFTKLAEKKGIIITSYALLHRDLKYFNQVNWKGIILDEAQNVKNPDTKQAKAARSIKADFRAALTGTPVENNVGDLWSIMEFLNGGFLGSRADFKRRFYVPIQIVRDRDAAQTLRRLTGPFILRRLKTDKSIISDLPDKNEMKVYCSLTKEQASLYRAVVKDTEKKLKEAEGIERRGIMLSTLMKLKQVCNHPAQLLGDNTDAADRSGKLSRLTEMLEEVLSVDEKALVFTQFAEMGKIIQKHLQETLGREVLFLYGATPKKKRDEMIERFQNSEDGPPVFVLSLKAGGTGLNLTEASHVFHFDRWWNPAVENQATDRAFRIGQTRNVQVHKFMCLGTLEEKIDEIIESKKAIAGEIVGTGEKWLTELSTEEFREVIRLSEDLT